ncbi:hypothetical protein B5X24_HaOG204993 [Helicoverpa armigera]|nr:hypothetical protein B5X24_HaOG204993 [Helicoverpa armigera]
MPPEIRLTISQNDKLIQTITKTVEGQHLVKSLEEFQIEANAALTKMIEELGEIGEAGGDANLEDDEDDDETDDEDADSSLSTSEDSKGHSTSKRKKHN